MKKKLQINGREIEVDFISKNGSKVIFNFDGKEHEYTLKENKSGKLTLSDQNNKNSTVYSAKDGLYDCESGQFKIQSVSKTSQESDRTSQSSLISPLPGKVVKVCVDEGAQVKEGDEIVRIEAMKMEHRICAQFNGVLKSLKVKEGDIVSDGILLGEIE